MPPVKFRALFCVDPRAYRVTAATKMIVLSGAACALFCCPPSGMAADTPSEPASASGAAPIVPQPPTVPPEPAAPERWSIHGQFTNVIQYHPSFTSPYLGQNSLEPGASSASTVDLTLFAGVRLWRGGEIYANPEIDQGFGLSDTVGVAGFPSGEAYKVGSASPYLRLQRLFFRQVVNLGGIEQEIEPAANQLGGTRAADNIVLTAGKFSVVDIFDTNRYAHDPRADFLNWSVIDGGAFDYAADAWGYSYGAAAEWTRAWWTLRGGVFALSQIPQQ